MYIRALVVQRNIGRPHICRGKPVTLYLRIVLRRILNDKVHDIVCLWRQILHRKLYHAGLACSIVILDTGIFTVTLLRIQNIHDLRLIERGHSYCIVAFCREAGIVRLILIVIAVLVCCQDISFRRHYIVDRTRPVQQQLHLCIGRTRSKLGVSACKLRDTLVAEGHFQRKVFRQPNVCEIAVYHCVHPVLFRHRCRHHTQIIVFSRHHVDADIDPSVPRLLVPLPVHAGKFHGVLVGLSFLEFVKRVKIGHRFAHLQEILGQTDAQKAFSCRGKRNCNFALLVQLLPRTSAGAPIEVKAQIGIRPNEHIPINEVAYFICGHRVQLPYRINRFLIIGTRSDRDFSLVDSGNIYLGKYRCKLVQSHLTHDILTLRGIRDLSGLNLKVISRTALEVEGGIGTSARTREHDHRLAILLLDHHILVIDRPVVLVILVIHNLSGRAVSRVLVELNAVPQQPGQL